MQSKFTQKMGAWTHFSTLTCTTLKEKTFSKRKITAAKSNTGIYSINMSMLVPDSQVSCTGTTHHGKPFCTMNGSFNILSKRKIYIK